MKVVPLNGADILWGCSGDGRQKETGVAGRGEIRPDTWIWMCFYLVPP